MNLPRLAIATCQLKWMVWQNRSAIVVQMPAQSGEVLAAIYRSDRQQNQLVEILPDAVMNLEFWKNLLKN